MSKIASIIRIWLKTSITLALTAVAAEQGRGDTQENDNVADYWAVGEQPVIVFERSSREVESEFVYVVDVALTRNRSFVIADQEHGTISIYSAQGDLITYFGGIGEGPSEFTRIARVVVNSRDRIFVFDEGRQRLSEWTIDGKLVSGHRIQYHGSWRPIGDVGQFASGEWYAMEADRMLGATLDGVAQDTVRFVRLQEGFVVGQQLTQVRGAIATHFIVDGVPIIRHALLSPRPLSVAMGECLVVGTSEAPILEIVHRAGTKKGSLVLEVEVRSTGAASRREWIRSTVAEIGRLGGELDERATRMIEGMGKRMPMAQWIPFAHAMIVDGLGYIWTQDYRLPGGSGSVNWRVFTETGRAVGTVKLPQGLRVMAISEGVIIAVGENAHGLQEVRLYRLDRGGFGEKRPVPLGCVE